MSYFLAILPAIIIIALILVLAYLAQKSIKNKYIKPLEDRVEGLEKELKQKDEDIRGLTTAFIELQSEVERMAVNEMKILQKNNLEDL